MDNVKQSSTAITFKWAVIYVITAIVLTYVFQFLNLDQTSPVKYVSYIPFIAFLFLAQKEFRDKLNGFITFGQALIAGLIYSVFVGVMFAVFLYVYFTFLSPQVWEQTLALQRAKLEAVGTLSSDQIDNAMKLTEKYGVLLTAIGTIFVMTIFGIIVALIGAAIFKKERSILDIEQSSSYVDPTV